MDLNRVSHLGSLIGTSFLTIQYGVQEVYNAQWSFKNGLTYSGEWKNDKMHGHGTAKWQREGDVEETYTGEFKDGKKDGYVCGFEC